MRLLFSEREGESHPAVEKIAVLSVFTPGLDFVLRIIAERAGVGNDRSHRHVLRHRDRQRGRDLAVMKITEFVRGGLAAVRVFRIADIQGIVRAGVFTFQIAAARRQFQGNGLAQFNGVRDPQEKIPLVIVVDLLVDGQGGGEPGY